MKYSGKWYQRSFRYVQVKWFILTKRYRPVQGGINFYADMRHGGAGVKGYYWRPMSYNVKVDMNSLRESVKERDRNETEDND